MKKNLTLFLIFIFFIVILFFYFHLEIEFEIRIFLNKLLSLSKENYFFSFIIFLITYIIAVIINLPLGLILSLFAGFIFGPYLGTLLSISAITIGSYTLFKILKKFKLKKLLEKIKIKNPKIIEYARKDISKFSLIIRIIPGTPVSIQNIILAYLNIKDNIFLITTLIGSLPITFIVVNFGWQSKNLLLLQNRPTLFDLLSLNNALFLIFLIIIIIFFKYDLSGPNKVKN